MHNRHYLRGYLQALNDVSEFFGVCLHRHNVRAALKDFRSKLAESIEDAQADLDTAIADVGYVDTSPGLTGYSTGSLIVHGYTPKVKISTRIRPSKGSLIIRGYAPGGLDG